MDGAWGIGERVMMRLRKLYLDLIADDGSVCIAYVTALDLAGLKLAPCGVELYGANQDREVRRGRSPLSLRWEPGTAELSCVPFELDGVIYAFETEPEQAGLQPECSPVPGFDWRVKLARGRGRLRRIDGRGTPLSGESYADWVELTQLPRSLGLRSLEWGRLHLDAGTVIYTEATRRAGPPFRAASLWAKGQAAQPISEWELSAPSQEGARVLRLGRHGDGLEVELRPRRRLHQGAATDGARFPSLVEQAFYRAVAGPMREQRWLSHASSASLGNGWAIHESVQFGGRSRCTQ